MSSLLLGSISATLGLDNSGFRRGIVESEALTATFGQTFTTALTNPLLAGIGLMKTFGAVAVTALTNAAQAMAELAGKAEELDNLSKRTGLSTDMLQGLDLALRNAGGEAGSFRAAVDAMARKLGDAETDGGRTVAQLTKLGLTLDSLRGRSKDDVFGVLLDRIQALEDPFERAAFSADFFDRTVGLKLIGSIEGGSRALAGFIEQNKQLGTIMDGRVVQSAVKFDGALDDLGNSADGLFQKLTGAALEGFASGMGNAGNGAKEASQVISETLVPAVRALGQEVGEFAQKLDMVLTKSREIKATGFDFLAGATTAVGAGSGWATAAEAERALQMARRAGVAQGKRTALTK